mgnify:FL=1
MTDICFTVSIINVNLGYLNQGIAGNLQLVIVGISDCSVEPVMAVILRYLYR